MELRAERRWVVVPLMEACVWRGLERAVPHGVRSWSGESALGTLPKNSWLPKITGSPTAAHSDRGHWGLQRHWMQPAGSDSPWASGQCWWPGCPHGKNWAMPSLAHPCQPGAPSIFSAPQLPSTPARRTCLQGFIGNSVVTCRGFTVPGPAPPGPALGVFGLWQLSLVHSQQFVPGLAAAHPQCLCQPAAPPARHGASPAVWHLQRSQVLG